MIQLAPEFLGGFKNVRVFGFFVDADNRLWVTFIEGKIFCLGDPVVR
mgnify:CR=1 FL=1